MTSNAAMTFPGYTILERLEETNASSIYKATRTNSGDTVIIKVISNRHASPARNARFKHEYEIIRGIDNDGIVKTLDLMEWDDTIVLVKEDFNGDPLKAFLLDNFSMGRFFKVAIRLIEILNSIHQKDISHRNIKPLSVLLDTKTDRVKITFFGIESEISEVSGDMVHLSDVDGSLAYISPEQTGRMNSSVDYRTDLYSLGVLFYEMLSGQVPFFSQNPMDVIHAHIAKIPTPLSEVNPDIPVAVSDIVMKLLAKSVQGRYQSCEGLEADLKKCFHQWEKFGRIAPFPLGSKDMSLGFNTPIQLVGRDKELSILNSAFGLVAQGTVEVVFVTGEPGIGKSALIQEIQKHIIEKQGYFISGKFDQYSKGVPYSAIMQAFQALALQLLSENETRLALWKNRILKALGKNGKIITEFIPELEMVIGIQPEVTELGPEEASNRFNMLFKNFVSVFASENHPMVLFLDDLQWADRSSLTLIKTILSDPGLRHMLLVGAYRENDVQDHHPVTVVREAMFDKEIPIHTIHLGPLDVKNIAQLISTFIPAEAKEIVFLAKIIHKKTKGSPFFIHQFLKSLYEKGHIHFVRGKGWSCDMAKIADMRSTDNVVEFLADKIHDLSPPSKEVIRICSCIGNIIDVDILGRVTRRPMGEVIAIMDHLNKDGMVGIHGEHYRFHHDRIQEAAYSLLSKEERRRIHARIGHLFLEDATDETLNSRVFEICDQLNHGAAPMAGPKERLRLSELNLKAGIKAKESAAYTAAVSYLAKANSYLPENPWGLHYNLTYTIYSKLMECHYLSREFGKAEKLFDVIVKHARSRLDKAQAYYVMITLYTNTRGPEDTVLLGLKALDILYDIKIPPNIGYRGVVRDLKRTKNWLNKKAETNRDDLTIVDDKDLDACLMLFFSIGIPAYYFNQNLFAKVVLKAFNMAVSRGLTVRYESVAIIAVATIIQSKMGDYQQGYLLGKTALQLDYHADYHKTAGMVHHTFGYLILHWRKHTRNCLDIYRKAYQLSMDAGDFIFAGHSITSIADCGLMVGINLDDLLKESTAYDDAMKVLKNPFSANRHAENKQYIYNLQGRTNHRLTLSGPDYDEEVYLRQLHDEKNYLGLCYFLLLKLKLYYLYGEYEKALEKAVEAEKYITIYMGTQIVVEHNFYYSLILSALLLSGKGKRIPYRFRLYKNQIKMRGWAEICPENFGHKYDLVAAEVAAYCGYHRKALGLYRSAVKKARKNAYLHEEAIASERLALFYVNHSGEDEARMFMQRACQCYESWGAKTKVADLDERYPELVREWVISQGKASSSGYSDSDSTLDNIDLTTVTEVSQLISKEIKLDRLLHKIMHLSIANAGAERGYLILDNKGRLTIQASEDVVSGERLVLQNIPVDSCDGLSPAIVKYVFHKGKHVILGDASHKGPFMNDPHVTKRSCKSVLCMPIMNKGDISCILYMENNLVPNAFTDSRLHILRVISAQVAISLQNAKLYEKISNEMTVRKKAVAAVKVSEIKYRTILEEMQDAYCELDLKARITFINPNGCAIAGYSKNELVGSDLRSRFSSEDERGVERYFSGIYTSGKPGKPYKCMFKTKKGNHIHLEIVASPMRNKANQIIGFRILGRDVSERKRLEKDLLESSRNVQAARAATIMGLAKLSECRDEDTGAHLERIREYTRIVAMELSRKPEYSKYITEEYIEDIYNSSILHDIGKVGVPDAVLLKPGKLTKEEFEIIKTHSRLGGDALKAVEDKIQGQTFLTLSKEIAYYHHEKWDGTGYPKGLKGKEIPLSARIVALADVYDALTSNRIYKKAYSHQKAKAIIVNDRGKHFAPDVVDAFLVHEEEFRRIREELFSEQLYSKPVQTLSDNKAVADMINILDSKAPISAS